MKTFEISFKALEELKIKLQIYLLMKSIDIKTK